MLVVIVINCSVLASIAVTFMNLFANYYYLF